MSTFDNILFPLKWVVASLMVLFHNALGWLGMDTGSGVVWVISIVLLTVTIRIVLIPLFVRQIKASRAMQTVAPELQKIQAKYKGRKDQAAQEAMGRETMALYRKHGANPLSSCWPILLQSPIFFALFRVLNSLSPLATGDYPRESIGLLTQELAYEASQATFLGANITSWFLQPDATVATRIVTVVLVVAMSVTTFTTQKQLTQKNMPAAALQGPMAQQQKIMLYALPLIFAVSGVNFPIGVLVYWTTTNLWSMGQQFYVIRRNPTPGSEAERLLKERRAAKAAKKGIILEEEKPETTEPEQPRGQRQQPKRKNRSGGQRPQGGPGASAPGKPGGTGDAAGSTGERAAGAAGAAGVAGAAGQAKAPGAGGSQARKKKAPPAPQGKAPKRKGATAPGGAPKKPAGGGAGSTKPAGGGAGSTKPTDGAGENPSSGRAAETQGGQAVRRKLSGDAAAKPADTGTQKPTTPPADAPVTEPDPGVTDGGPDGRGE